MSESAYAPGLELPGGFINALVRVGDTVRRPRGENAAFVEALLERQSAREEKSEPELQT